jgi:hypothetical protein
MCSRAPFLQVTLVAVALASSLSCNSPMKIRRDAGATVDAVAQPDAESRMDTAIPDAALNVAQEVAPAEVAVDRGATPDQAVSRATPAGFRIVPLASRTRMPSLLGKWPPVSTKLPSFIDLSTSSPVASISAGGGGVSRYFSEWRMKLSISSVFSFAG